MERRKYLLSINFTFLLFSAHIDSLSSTLQHECQRAHDSSPFPCHSDTCFNPFLFCRKCTCTCMIQMINKETMTFLAFNAYEKTGWYFTDLDHSTVTCQLKWKHVILHVGHNRLNFTFYNAAEGQQWRIITWSGPQPDAIRKYQRNVVSTVFPFFLN